MWIFSLKKELDRLRAIVLFHETHCKKNHEEQELNVNDASSKTGSGGQISCGPSGDCGDTADNELLPALASTSHMQQDDSRNINLSEKSLLIPNKTSVLLPKTSEVEVNKTPLSKEKIISSIRKRFQKKAGKLLDEIGSHPLSVSYDSQGVTSINGQLVQGSDIRDLLASCFYSIKSKHVNGLQLWNDMLRETNLYHYVVNPDHQHNIPNDEEWFFLGNLT